MILCKSYLYYFTSDKLNFYSPNLNPVALGMASLQSPDFAISGLWFSSLDFESKS